MGRYTMYGLLNLDRNRLVSLAMELQNKRDEFQNAWERKVSENIKLKQEIDELSNLEPIIEKVKLPREVAEAIEKIYKSAAPGEQVDIEYIIEGSVKQEFNDFYDALNHVGVELLARALINGYTIEEEPEEHLKDKVYQEIRSWWTAPEENNLDDDIRMLAQRIAAIVNSEKAT